MAPVIKKKKQIPKMDLQNTTINKSTVVSGQLEKQIENRKMKKSKGKPERGLLFIKNLPHGFFEAQMKKYFKQFGKVTNLRLGRSKKTGKSKGFAYVEFEVPEVAEVVAETMNNYIMFQKLLKAAYIPPDEQKYNYFKSSVKLVKNPVGKMKFVSNATRRTIRQMKRQNDWNDEIYTKRTKQTIKKLNKIKNKYYHLGINFDNLTIKPGDILGRNDSNSKNESNDLENSTETDKSSTSEKSVEESEGEPKNLLIKKRKATPEKTVSPISKKMKTIKADSPELTDLLENTIQDEDSSDEDFIPINDSEKDKEDKINRKKSNIKKTNLQLNDLLDVTLKEDDSSDEDFTPFNEDIEDEDSDLSESDESAESDIESEDDQVINKFVKIPKQIKEDGFEKLIKRKPHLGGIQKNNKKSNKSKGGDKIEKLKLVAAKEILKTQKPQNVKYLKKNKKIKV